MFKFLRTTLFHARNGCTQNPSVAASLSLKYLSSDANNRSFAVSYFINTCGLSPESLVRASRSVRFQTPVKLDLLISFFEKLGLSKTQISEIIRKFPGIFAYSLEKNIVHKVEFFRTRGASSADIARILTSAPSILGVALESQLVPNFNFYRDLFQSEEKAMEAVKRYPSILSYKVGAHRISNIKILKENGVPAARISHIVRRHPRLIGNNSEKFAKIVGELREMGFDPLKSMFVEAVRVRIGCSKSMRDKKIDVYKSWGWSDNDIITAFKKFPMCMAISEDKILEVMDFYINKLGLDSSVIANRPMLLSLSLKKRLIPRAAVIQFLISQGQLKSDSRITRLFECTEKCFLEKYVNFHEEGPHLLKLYNEKLELLQPQVHQQNT